MDTPRTTTPVTLTRDDLEDLSSAAEKDGSPVLARCLWSLAHEIAPDAPPALPGFMDPTTTADHLRLAADFLRTGADDSLYHDARKRGQAVKEASATMESLACALDPQDPGMAPGPASAPPAIASAHPTLLADILKAAVELGAVADLLENAGTKTDADREAVQNLRDLATNLATILPPLPANFDRDQVHAALRLGSTTLQEQGDKARDAGNTSTAAGFDDAAGLLAAVAVGYKRKPPAPAATAVPRSRTEISRDLDAASRAAHNGAENATKAGRRTDATYLANLSWRLAQYSRGPIVGMIGDQDPAVVGADLVTAAAWLRDRAASLRRETPPRREMAAAAESMADRLVQYAGPAHAAGLAAPVADPGPKATARIREDMRGAAGVLLAMHNCAIHGRKIPDKTLAEADSLARHLRDHARAPGPPPHPAGGFPEVGAFPTVPPPDAPPEPMWITADTAVHTLRAAVHTIRGYARIHPAPGGAESLHTLADRVRDVAKVLASAPEPDHQPPTLPAVEPAEIRDALEYGARALGWEAARHRASGVEAEAEKHDARAHILGRLADHLDQHAIAEGQTARNMPGNMPGPPTPAALPAGIDPARLGWDLDMACRNLDRLAREVGAHARKGNGPAKSVAVDLKRLGDRLAAIRDAIRDQADAPEPAPAAPRYTTAPNSPPAP